MDIRKGGTKLKTARCEEFRTVKGRDCGDIALYTGVAGGAESVITSEKGYDINEICKMILEGKQKG